MSNLRVSNANIITAQTDTLVANGTTVSNTVSIGSSVINSTAIAVGTNIINSTVLQTSSFILNGVTLGPTYTAIVNTQIFTNNGTWTNPISNTSLGLTGNSIVFIMMWGAGGSGKQFDDGLGAITDTYGGGGACVIHQMPLSMCNTVCNVIVGSVGGSNTIFYPNTTFSITAYNGGDGSVSSVDGGGGGGWFSAGSSPNGGEPLGGDDSTFGGGADSRTSIFGGGGANDKSIFGGAGGVGGINNQTSVFGGRGGSSAASAQSPGGGGGPTEFGARGEVRVWVLK